MQLLKRVPGALGGAPKRIGRKEAQPVHANAEAVQESQLLGDDGLKLAGLLGT